MILHVETIAIAKDVRTFPIDTRIPRERKRKTSKNQQKIKLKVNRSIVEFLRSLLI